MVSSILLRKEIQRTFVNIIIQEFNKTNIQSNCVTYLLVIVYRLYTKVHTFAVRLREQ